MPGSQNRKRRLADSEIADANSRSAPSKRQATNSSKVCKTTITQVSRTSDSKHTLPRSSLSESAVIDPSNEISDEVETRKLQRPNPKCLRFSDGDVYIELQPRSSVYQYQLHSSVLVRVSEKFKEIASQPPPEEPDEKLAAKFRKERCIAAWFKLYYDTEWKEQLLKRTTLTGTKNSKQALSVALPSIELVSTRSLTDMTSIANPRKASSVQPGTSTEKVPVPRTTASIGQINDVVISHNLTIEAKNIATYTDRFEADIGQFSMMSEDSPANLEKSSVQNHDKITTEDIIKTVAEDSSMSIGEKDSSAIPTSTVKPGNPDAKVEDDIVTNNKAILDIGDRILKGENLSSRMDSTKQDSISVPSQELITEKEERLHQQDEMTESCPTTTQQDLITEPEEKAGSVTKEIRTELEKKENIQNAQNCTNREIIRGPSKEILDAHRNLFLIYYNRQPAIDSASIHNALQQTDLLIKITHFYGSLPVVRPYLRDCLLQYGRRLYEAVLDDPLHWLHLSLELECAPIFKEAVIHLVGNISLWSPSHLQLERLPENVSSLIEKKLNDLRSLKVAVDQELFINAICVNKKEIALKQTEEHYFDTWTVVQVWRDWYTQNLAQAGSQERLKVTNATMYRIMAKSGDAYLPLQQTFEALSLLRKETENLDREEVINDMIIMKDFAKETVFSTYN